MTVQELISHLGQFKPETEVMFSYLDDTDFLYKTFMTEDDIELGNLLSDNSDDDDDKNFNEEGDYIGPEVVLFNLNLD